jgi:hypothetical protein
MKNAKPVDRADLLQSRLIIALALGGKDCCLHADLGPKPFSNGELLTIFLSGLVKTSLAYHDF